MSSAACPLCETDGGTVVLRHPRLRIIRASEAGFPAFYRVVWNDHVAEWTDLSEADQALCMRAVSGVERVLRLELAPTKINLASLGNVVPHLHWHVIARFEGDSHFPAPVWAAPQREPDASWLARLEAALPGCDALIAQIPL